MATRIRVLVYDHGKNSVSVLTHLNKKDMLFYDTATKFNPNAFFSSSLATIVMAFKEQVCKFVPNFDNEPSVMNKKVPFDKWWNKPIIKDKNNNILTRATLIRFVSNQDGGAHVDAELKHPYDKFTKKNSMGISFAFENYGGPVPNLELASVRQIAYELLKSLKDEFPGLLDEEDIKTTVKFSNVEKKHESFISPVDEDGLDEKSLRNYLKTSPNVKYWVNYIKSLGIQIGMIGWISRDIEMIKLTDIRSIDDIDTILINAKGWGEKYLAAAYQNIFGKTDIIEGSTDLNGVLTFFLIANYPEIFTDEILEHKFGYGSPEKVTIPAKKFNIT